VEAAQKRGLRLELAVRGLPFAVVAALAAFMVERDGGYAVTVWYPVGLVVLAVLVTLAWSAGSVRGLERAVAATVLVYASFVAWMFLTIAWADVRGDAWEGANRALVYLLVLATLATWRTSPRAVWPLLVALALVVDVEGAITAAQVARAGDPSRFLIGSRLSEPLGYPNATGALYMLLVWLMAGLASRPWLAAPVRGLCLGLAGLSLTLNALTESRGSVYTLPLAIAAYLLLVPGRMRSLAWLGLLALGFLPTAVPIFDVYGASHIGPAYRRALEVGVVWAVILVVAGTLLAALEPRVRLSARAVRRMAVAIAGAALAGAVALLVAFQPWSHVGSAWHSFKSAGEPGGGAVARFGGLGSNRYDFWRVGLIEFRRHPLQGIGADNFVVPYLQQRRSTEQPAFPHSFFVDLLSQTGVVGTVAFAAFVVLVLVAVLRIPPGRNRELARILIVAALVWLLHAQVDWLWEMPVLGVLGMGLLGTALGLVPRRPAGPAGRRSRRALASVAALSTLAVLAAGWSLAGPWLAAREVQAAASEWQTDSTGAFARLDRARGFDPLSDEPDLVAGAIASRLHRFALARDHFRAAVRRSPDDWYANLELGVAASLAGPRGLAASSLRRALALDPRDPVVRSVARRYAAGKRLDPDAIDRAILAED